MATANNSNPPWKPGQSGNPSGRPKGTRHHAGYVLELMAARSLQMPWCPSPRASCPTYRCIEARTSSEASRPVEGHRDAAGPWLRHRSTQQLDIALSVSDRPLELLSDETLRLLLVENAGQLMKAVV